MVPGKIAYGSRAYLNARLRVAKQAAVELARANAPISARSIQSKIKGTRLSKEQIVLLVEHAKNVTGLPVLRGTRLIQPKWEKKMGARYSQMKAYLLGRAKSKRPVSPSEFKRSYGCRLEVAKACFQRALKDEEFLAQLKAEKVELIRAPLVGIHRKRQESA